MLLCVFFCVLVSKNGEKVAWKLKKVHAEEQDSKMLRNFAGRINFTLGFTVSSSDCESEEL